MIPKIEALNQMGCYLHQSWPSEFETPMDAVQSMVKCEPADMMRQMAAEIRTLLATDLTEAEWADLMEHKVGSYYNPRSDGKSYKAWLGDILQVLETCLMQRTDAD